MATVLLQLLLVVSTLAPSLAFASTGVQLRDLYVRGFQPGRAKPHLCPVGGTRDLTLMIIVMSNPTHQVQRDRVRFSWRPSGFERIGFAFLLGAPTDPDTRADVAREDSIHRDLLVTTMAATARLEPLQFLAMLDWLASYCPHAAMLFKADDDMFVNVRQLYHLVNRHVGAGNTAWGRVARAGGLRYVSGEAMMLTGDVARLLLHRAGPARYLPRADVLFTGVMARQLDVVLKGEWVEARDRCPNDDAIQRALAVKMRCIDDPERFLNLTFNLAEI